MGCGGAGYKAGRGLSGGAGARDAGAAIEKSLSVWRTRFRGMGGDGLLYWIDGGRIQHGMAAHSVGEVKWRWEARFSGSLWVEIP